MFTFITALNASGVCVKKSPNKGMPALATTVSRQPNSATAVLISFLMLAISEQSPAMAMQIPFSPVIFLWHFQPVQDHYHLIIPAPANANCGAILNPIPIAAPVIMATLCSDNFILFKNATYKICRDFIVTEPYT